MAINWDAEVLAPMMGANVFGETVQPIYTPAWGEPFAIDGVFDDAYLGVTLTDDGSPGFQTFNPVLGVRLSQFCDAPVQGDKVFIASVGKTYFVNEVKADGHGWAKLELTLSA